MAKNKVTVNFEELKGINSAADFYGWKAHIVDEIGKTDKVYALALENTNSLMDLFMQKEQILAKLGVSE